MRIGLVTFYFPPLVRGGAHLSAYYIAKGLAERGHEVHVFTAQPLDRASQQNRARTWAHPDIQCQAIFPITKPTTAWAQDWASLLMGRQLRHYLGQLGLHFDVLHAYGMDTIPAVALNRHYGRAAATFNGYWASCPFWDHTAPATHDLCVVCGYSRLGDCVRQRDRRRNPARLLAKWHYLYFSLRLRQYFAQRVDLLLPISQSVQTILEQNHFPVERMRVCYNMIDADEYEKLDPHYLHDRFGLERSRRILLYAGRFAPYKGCEYILEAAPGILARHPDAHFVFIGQGSTLPALQAMSRRLRLDECVTFGPFIDPKEMPHAYASAYALLHTATWPEPFARGPVETLAAGTAVIGTATGGTREIIADDETGLLIPPFNAAAITEAANRLLNDPTLRDRLAERGRALVSRRFSIEGQIGAYIGAYESIL